MKRMKFKAWALLLLLSVSFWGCKSDHEPVEWPRESSYAYELGVIAAFSELINAGVKKLALSAPMNPENMDAFIIEAETIAAKHNVSVFREPELIITDLFPTDIATGRDVLLLYQGTTKDAYLRLKADKEKLVASDAYLGNSRMEIARRFGRMLSYAPQKINQLISQNTSFRTMNDFGIRASNVFLYYKDLKGASRFYSNVLGLERLANYDNADIFRIASDSYLILVDATKGMHTADEPKTVALALVTDQLDEWYTYIKSQNVEIKYDYKPKEGRPHDGFVVYDPEGYLLEFERFNQHPENEDFIPILDQQRTISNRTDQSSQVPEGLGFNASITWLYYQDVMAMQTFAQNVLGLELVADQGWAKIYKAADSGFIGLVDERRGMHKWTEKKAVTVSFILDELDPWFDYVIQHQPFELRSTEIGTAPDDKYRAFVGYDPEGYYLEFDTFYPHEDNGLLLKYLNEN